MKRHAAAEELVSEDTCFALHVDERDMRFKMIEAVLGEIPAKGAAFPLQRIDYQNLILIEAWESMTSPTHRDMSTSLRTLRNNRQWRS
jgi:hypothetical protein